jgi:acyl-CoA thioesterase-2
MPLSTEELVSLLDLERIEVDIFRGRSPQVGWQRVFGGLVVSQALVAAARTVEAKSPHSLHGYFILPGDPSVPIVYEVDRIRDGKSFATRRCVAVQHGRAIFTLAASFQVEEEGLAHQISMPQVPGPENLVTEKELIERFGSGLPESARLYLSRERPIELRPVDLRRYIPGAQPTPIEPVQHLWVRAAGKLPDDPALHRAVLAYLSDLTLLDTALVVHQRSLFDAGLQIASLDHALWFHRPFRADEWLLYAQESPTSGSARGLTRGSLFARDGRLIASVMQEGLIRQTRSDLSILPKK